MVLLPVALGFRPWCCEAVGKLERPGRSVRLQSILERNRALAWLRQRYVSETCHAPVRVPGCDVEGTLTCHRHTIFVSLPAWNGHVVEDQRPEFSTDRPTLNFRQARRGLARFSR